MVKRRWSLGRRGRGATAPRTIVLLLLVAVACGPAPSQVRAKLPAPVGTPAATPSPAPVSNFTASINRLVDLVALAGSGILALVWARVALSWFSNDITKKIQAKDRARDALIGTLIFMAAVTGLLYGLAHWVLTGS